MTYYKKMGETTLQEIDLSKSLDKDHPLIEEKIPYLVRYDGKHVAGVFSRQYKGLVFEAAYGRFIDYESPHIFGSKWEKVWLIISPESK